MKITYTISGIQQTQEGDVPAILDTDSLDFLNRLKWILATAKVEAVQMIAGRNFGPDSDGKYNQPLDTITVVFASPANPEKPLAIDAVMILREPVSVAATLGLEFGIAVDAAHLAYPPEGEPVVVGSVNQDVNGVGSPIGQQIPTTDAKRFKVAAGNQVAEGAIFHGLSGVYVAVRRGLGPVSMLFWEMK
jgi:hypothetical protein